MVVVLIFLFLLGVGLAMEEYLIEEKTEKENKYWHGM
jgi:hypothetical protein